MYTTEYVARRIDHAVLQPDSTQEDVVAGAELCRQRDIGCLCVRPIDVRIAADRLRDVDCKVGAVIGFPHGGTFAAVKAAEAERAIAEGAVELDMVMNIGQFLSEHPDVVQNDIEAVVTVAAPRGVLVKVILETCFLTPQQIAEACRLAQAAGADFVKTSTGFASGGATPEAIEVMRTTVGSTMGIKASGGIRDWATAVAYLRQGCSRLGIGATQAVLDGAQAEGNY